MPQDRCPMPQDVCIIVISPDNQLVLVACQVHMAGFWRLGSSLDRRHSLLRG